MINNTLFFAMLSIFAINGIYAQNKSTASVNQQLKWLYSQQQKNALLQMSIAFDEDFKREKANAEKIAKEKGWEIIIENDSVYMELMRISKYGTPIYYTIHNRTAAKSTRANTLHNGGLLSLNLEGQGMTAYVWDAGIARETHQEYDGVGGNNRFSVGDYATELQDHSAHVMGTIIASGVTASAKGMAPQAYGIGNNWSNDLSEMSSAAANGMLISNHSYGVEIAGNPAKNFGKYSSSARSYDQILYNAPGWLMVLSAGNDGTRNSYNTAPLGGDNNYDKLIDHPVVKNNLVVANGTDAGIDDDGNLTFALIHTSSSQGPTDDYRIKPDITGNGADLYSTISTADDAYTYKNGTSMAAPSVTGTLLLLQQHYNNENSAFMKAATLKGLALHTADDISYSGYSGQLDIIAGPDPISGWGYINGMKAAQTITGEGSISVIEERSLNNSESYTFDVYASGTEDLIASISWTDPPGIVNNAVVNDATPALVNDLDIRVTRGGSTYFPYKLTGVNTNTQADNTVDPFERVDVSTPVTGALYTITVTHKGTLNSAQNFSVIVTGVTPTGGGSELAIVSTDVPVSITINSATVGGNVTDNGGHTVTERGIVWSTSINPTTSNNKLQIGTGNGTFTSTLSGLSENTTYHVRAYAINSEGTSYGSNKQFTTLSAPVKPVAAFSGIPLIINENQDVIFTDLSIYSPTSWLWSVSPNTGVSTIGGTDLNSQNPQIQFANAGNYTITLVASNIAGDSDPVSKIDYITVNAGTQDYCVSTYTAASTAQIENVTFNTINNNSSDATTDGYEDFTSISTTVNINSTYTLSVTASTTAATDYIEAYFDWNADGDWTDAGEMVSVGTLTNQTSGVVSTNVTVPSGASLSAIRMRINTEFNHVPGPCDADHLTEYGETEDYTINISDYITGIVSLSKENVVIFPNPVESILHVRLPIEDVKIQLININGERLKIIESKNTKNIDINIEDIATGIYQLVITTENNEQITLKVVKM